MLEMAIDTEPYVPGVGQWRMGMDVRRVEQVSSNIRQLMRRLCPEFVATADNLSSAVRYIPVSALGTSPEVVERDGHRIYGVRPQNVNPKWSTVPLLYCLCKWSRGLIAPVGAPDKRESGAT